MPECAAEGERKIPLVGSKEDWTRGSQGVRSGDSKEGFWRRLGPEQVFGVAAFGVGVAVVRGVRALRRTAKRR